jgi:hypothetical protein
MWSLGTGVETKSRFLIIQFRCVALWAQESKANNMRRWIFHAFLMTLLLLGGAGWVQGRDDLQDQERQQPLQTEMVNKDQQSLDLSIDRHNSTAKEKKAARDTNIKKSTESRSPKAESFKPLSRQYGISKARSKGPQCDTLESGLMGMGYNQSSGFDSTSFLDDYLLKSLHDDNISKESEK